MADVKTITHIKELIPDAANARRLAIYAQAAIASLEGEGDIGHLVRVWKFPQPMVEGA